MSTLSTNTFVGTVVSFFDSITLFKTSFICLIKLGIVSGDSIDGVISSSPRSNDKG